MDLPHKSPKGNGKFNIFDEPAKVWKRDVDPDKPRLMLRMPSETYDITPYSYADFFVQLGFGDFSILTDEDGTKYILLEKNIHSENDKEPYIRQVASDIGRIIGNIRAFLTSRDLEILDGQDIDPNKARWAIYIEIYEKIFKELDLELISNGSVSCREGSPYCKIEISNSTLSKLQAHTTEAVKILLAQID